MNVGLLFFSSIILKSYIPAAQMQVADALSRCQNDTSFSKRSELTILNFPYMQENVGNITFANDGKVEFENASVEINNVELFGDIDVADEDNDPLEISKEISESSLPKNVQGRVYSEEPVQVVSECRSPQDGQICSEINEVNAILPITFVLIPDMTNIQLVILIH